jgi:hypothetical protein
MKTKQEIVQDLLEKSEETLTRIDIRMGFVQRKHAEKNEQHFLQELAQLTSDKKETEEWVAYLKTLS